VHFELEFTGINLRLILDWQTGVWTFSIPISRNFSAFPAESAAFQIVQKRRAHMLPIASESVQNIRQFVVVIAS
jgi:hypothetical protein